MRQTDLKNTEFKQGLIQQKMDIVSESIDTFVNSDAGVRTFDVALHAAKGNSKNAKLAAQVLKKILNNPKWNPNYTMPDTWHPEERAMIRGRQDVAIAVIKHPKFDKSQLPRVVAAAERFGSKKVLAFLKKQHVRG